MGTISDLIWNKWLVLQPSPLSGDFKHYIYREHSENRQIVKNELINIVREHHLETNQLINFIELLDYKKLAGVLRTQTFQEIPQREHPKTIKGNFGEVLLAEFASNLGFDVPIRRLRYNPNPNQPIKGDDLIGFKRDASMNIQTVMLGESKFRDAQHSKYLASEMKNVYKSLQRSPKSLDYVASVLDLMGQYDWGRAIRLAKARISANNKPPDMMFLMMLVTIDESYKPFDFLTTLPAAEQKKALSVEIILDRDFESWLRDLFLEAIYG